MEFFFKFSFQMAFKHSISSIDDTEGEMLITAHPAKQLNLK